MPDRSRRLRIGIRARSRRELLLLTQPALVAELRKLGWRRCNVAKLSDIEHGRVDLNLWQERILAHSLGLTADALTRPFQKMVPAAEGDRQ